jgi:hypothetical protein
MWHGFVTNSHAEIYCFCEAPVFCVHSFDLAKETQS